MQKTWLAILALGVVYFAGTFSSSAAEGQEQAAQAAAEQWLSLVDSGQFADSWQSAASYFQGAVTQGQWKNSLESVRKPLGSLESRSLKRARYTKAVPGAPSGDYVILQFQTSFSNKKDASETVTVMLAGDRWRVGGYLIK